LSVEVVLPRVVLDNVASAATTGLVLANRFPAPNSIDALPGTAIELDVLGLSGAAVDTSATSVWINGVLAWSAGGPQVGFSGSATTPLTNMERLSLQPDTAFDSEQVVSVRVVAMDVGVASLDETYSFTVADVRPPQVVSALAWGPDQVRVEFDEAIAAGSLAIGGFVFTALETPAVPIAATGVGAASGTAALVTLDQYMSFKKSYQVVVSGVTDVAGVVVDPAANTAAFTGFAPYVPRRRNFDLWTMLPEINRREDTSGDLAAFIGSLQDVLDVILYQTDRWSEIFDVTVASEAYIDRRLVGFGNPFRFEMTVREKARLALQLVGLYQLKGTAPGIEQAIEFFFPVANATVLPRNTGGWILGVSLLGQDTILWPSTTASIYSFDVEIDNDGVALTTAEKAQVRAIVDFTKRAATHFVDLLEV